MQSRLFCYMAWRKLKGRAAGLSFQGLLIAYWFDMVAKRAVEKAEARRKEKGQ